MRKNLWDISKECGLNSTSHSVPKTLKAKSLLIQIMWFTLTIASVVSCSYIISLIFSDYLKYEVVTQIRVVNEIKPPFPTVTICNKEPFVTRAGRDLVNKITGNFEERLANFTLEQIFESFSANYQAMSQLMYTNFTDEQKLLINYEISRFIYTCEFDLVPCDFSTFQWYLHIVYGLCYRFNTGYNFNNTKGELKETSLTSPTYGFKVSIFAGNENNEEPFNLHTYTSGVILFIGNDTFSPTFEDIIPISLNAETYIEVKRDYNRKLGSPYGNCLKDLSKSKSEYYKYLVSLNRTYRRSDCIEIARQVPIEKTCNCSFAYFIKYDQNIRRCESFEDLFCGGSVATSFVNLEYSYDICPLECESFSFSYSTSSSGPVNRRYLRALKKYFVNITDDDLASSVAFVNIYYNHLGYTEINEKPNYTTLSLISNVGGTLGLFMGLSLLSLFEIVELFILLLQQLNQQKKNKIMKINEKK
jgi:hypothetical protein